ncbi:hypothetical protein LOD99_7840 [Oopsacas minuta]|uniref:Uncharacterized protein n=1 Tax=Oopsacas minuta TaxID=111878 RepID=A0AAV7JPP3_9METZ|nr:hypothetical protein LOD99_7840 [Oopsacas minuta]
MLHEISPYFSYLKQDIDIIKENEASDARMIFRADGGPNPKRYNASTAPEIAVIMLGDGYAEGVATRDIVLNARTGGLQYITECNSAYDSLHYVLLFPSEDNGYT